MFIYSTDGKNFRGHVLADHITSAQIRAARALVDWSMVDLAKVAKVSVSTIKRMEDESLRPATERSVILIQDALEAAGVRFLSDDGDGPGVRYASDEDRLAG